MKDLKGTKTLENLMAAFAGESQATNKYSYFASQAKKEYGLCKFKRFLKKPRETKESIQNFGINMSVGIGTTEENLLTAAAGEHFECDRNVQSNGWKPPGQKASRKSGHRWKALRPLRRSMRSGIDNWQKT